MYSYRFQRSSVMFLEDFYLSAIPLFVYEWFEDYKVYRLVLNRMEYKSRLTFDSRQFWRTVEINRDVMVIEIFMYRILEAKYWRKHHFNSESSPIKNCNRNNSLRSYTHFYYFISIIGVYTTNIWKLTKCKYCCSFSKSKSIVFVKATSFRNAWAFKKKIPIKCSVIRHGGKRITKYLNFTEDYLFMQISSVYYTFTIK